MRSKVHQSLRCDRRWRRAGRMPEVNVAPLLVADVVSDLGESLYNLPSGKDGQPGHAFTVTTVSTTLRRRRIGTPSSAKEER